ncbi:OmpP1/FadL/TodX family outer membrane transporter [Fibrobacterales bacterium]|nr:OmpP1/FadL/TodX family outer membrane transporter [Fibrobacterales bacterium]
MNKFVKSVLAGTAGVLLSVSVSFAEGYQVNTLSAKQVGMANTGAGLKLGAENMNINPGGLGFLNKKIDLSAGVAAIFPEVEYSGARGFFETDGKPSTPFYFYGAFNIYDWFSAGVSFTTPFGNAANWGETWAGAELVQEISLQVFSIQPTLAFKIFDKVSIGGGPTINFGNFSLSRALIGEGALEPYRTLAQVPQLTAYAPVITGILDKYKDTPAASATLSGDADVKVGYNVGILYDLLKDKLAVGVSYRSKVDMKVSEGKAKMDYASEDDIPTLNNIIATVNNAAGTQVAPPIAIPPLEQGTFKAALPLPAILSTGISFKPIKDLVLDFDLTWINWSAYDSLIVQFSQEVLGGYSVRAPKRYHNSLSYRLGAQYALTDRFDVRGGVYYDESPVNSNYLNPETPSMDKLGLSTGFSFRPIPSLSIDAAFLYTTGFGRDGSYPVNAERAFKGHYEVQAWIPSIGVSFSL